MEVTHFGVNSCKGRGFISEAEGLEGHDMRQWFL